MRSRKSAGWLWLAGGCLWLTGCGRNADPQTQQAQQELSEAAQATGEVIADKAQQAGQAVRETDWSRYRERTEQELAEARRAVDDYADRMQSKTEAGKQETANELQELRGRTETAWQQVVSATAGDRAAAQRQFDARLAELQRALRSAK